MGQDHRVAALGHSRQAAGGGGASTGGAAASTGGAPGAVVAAVWPATGVSRGAPHCSTPYRGSSLGAEQSRRDELIGLRDDLVIDQDLAVQVRSIRPLDGHFHTRQLGVGQNRVDLERASRQQRRLFAVDVRVVDLVRDHRSAGCSVRTCPVGDVVQQPDRRRERAALRSGVRDPGRPARSPELTVRRPRPSQRPRSPAIRAWCELMTADLTTPA